MAGPSHVYGMQTASCTTMRNFPMLCLSGHVPTRWWRPGAFSLTAVGSGKPLSQAAAEPDVQHVQLAGHSHLVCNADEVSVVTMI